MFDILRRKKKYDIESFSIDRVLSKEHFSIPQNSHYTQEIVLKIRYFERGLSKSFKKVNFIFFFRNQSLLRDKVTLQVTKQVQKNAFISYKLSDRI